MNLADYLESFYSDRMMTLISNDRFDDAHSLFLEFVVDSEEPEEYLYLEELK